MMNKYSVCVHVFQYASLQSTSRAVRGKALYSTAASHNEKVTDSAVILLLFPVHLFTSAKCLNVMTVRKNVIYVVI